MTKIKLCGIRRLEDVQAVNELHTRFGIQYVGFIFAPKSRRYVEPALAAKLRAALLPEVETVGVFVNAPEDEILALYEAGTIQIAQLHGQEEESLILRLQAKGVPVIKAFRVDGEDDILSAEKSPADLVLVDSGDGGTGTCFDWSLLGRLERPFLLAGGLGPHNVRAAIEALHPYGVDVSSGIETDGIKDLKKMTAFVQYAREVE